MAVEKSQGLRKGEKVKRLGEIEVVNVRREQVRDITDADVSREGFPSWNRIEFIEFFCRVNSCTAHRMITRIEFKEVRR